MNRIFVERGTFFLADNLPLEPPALSRLADVKVPTLVVDSLSDWGENRRASLLLAEGIPGAKRIEVEGGHVSPLEDPARFAALWKNFL